MDYHEYSMLCFATTGMKYEYSDPSKDKEIIVKVDLSKAFIISHHEYSLLCFAARKGMFTQQKNKRI